MGSVEGYVTTGDGAAAPEASVMVADGPGPVPDIAAVSDGSGRFALDGLGDGIYLLRAFGPAGETGETSVFVYANDKTDVRIVLQPP